MNKIINHQTLYNDLNSGNTDILKTLSGQMRVIPLNNL